MDHKFIAFLSVLTVCILLQKVFQWRSNIKNGRSYWISLASNLSLVAVGNALIKLLQVFGLGSALFLQKKALLFSTSDIFGEQSIFSFLIAILILDFAIYWQHRMVHSIPILWRFHRVHHADRHMEASSGIRFHPIEIVFSFYYKLLICWFFGITVQMYFTFELLLMSSAIFNHSNMRIPHGIEKLLSLLIVTPRIHFVHHSQESRLMNQNFGFFLSLWDRVFRSFSKLDEKELIEMNLGVKNSNPEGPIELLKEPFL